jgi:hypothetical protein
MVDPCRTRTGGGFDHAVRQQEIAGREAGIENAAHHGSIAADHFDFQHRFAEIEHAGAGHFRPGFLDLCRGPCKIVTKRLRVCYQTGNEH